MEGDRASVVLQGGVGRKCCARTASKNNLFSCAAFAFLSSCQGAELSPPGQAQLPAAVGMPRSRGAEQGWVPAQPGVSQRAVTRGEPSCLHHVCWLWPACFEVSSFAGGFESIPCQTGCLAQHNRDRLMLLFGAWCLHRASGQFMLETISCRCTDRGY